MKNTLSSKNRLKCKRTKEYDEQSMLDKNMNDMMRNKSAITRYDPNKNYNNVVHNSSINKSISSLEAKPTGVN